MRAGSRQSRPMRVLHSAHYHTGHVSYVAKGEHDLLHQIFVLPCQEYSDQGRQTGEGLPDNSVLREITDGG